jgi:Domain of unknown function (DUF4349)
MRAGRTGAVAAVSLLLLSGAVGCAGSGSSAGSAGGGGSPEGLGQKQAVSHAAGLAPVSGNALQSAAAFDGLTSRAKLGPNAEPLLPPQRSTVIKTATLSLEVKKNNFPDAIERANAIATDMGGYVISTDRSAGRPSSAVIVIRVPASHFKGALAQMHSLGGGKVRSESVNGQEVGQEFVDLAARERNLRAQAHVLLRLMNRAVTVTDTIRVEGELSQVQGQIEQIAGRLRYLHDQADLSTITVSLREAGAHAPGQPTAIGSAFRRGWDRSVGVLTAVIAGAGTVIPVALLVGLALMLGLRLWPAVRGRLPARGPA